MAVGDPVPLFASLELTLRCNGACVYCGSKDAAQADGPEISTAEYKTIIDDLAESGCLAVSLTGGEPLLRPDVEALACRASGRGMSVGLNTNGRLMGDRRSILQYLSAVTVSIDSTQEINDAIRGPGAFAAAVAAIRTARHAGVDVSVTSVLSARSIDGLDRFFDWLESMKLQASFQPAYSQLLRSGGVNPAVVPSGRELAMAVERIKAARVRGVVGNSDRGLDIMLRSDSGRPVFCLGGRYFVRVAASGRLQVCGLDNDPCRPGGEKPEIDAREGIVPGMKRIGWPRMCAGCPGAARAELNGLLDLSRPDPHGCRSTR